MPVDDDGRRYRLVMVQTNLPAGYVIGVPPSGEPGTLLHDMAPLSIGFVQVAGPP